MAEMLDPSLVVSSAVWKVASSVAWKVALMVAALVERLEKIKVVW